MHARVVMHRGRRGNSVVLITVHRVCTLPVIGDGGFWIFVMEGAQWPLYIRAY